MTARPSTLATAGVVGGLTLFADLALGVFDSLDRAYYVIATVMALAMLGVPASVWLSGAVGRGSAGTAARVGTMIVAFGTAAWISAFVLLLQDPDEAFSQKLTPGGSALMALGMLVLGSAVLASRRRTGLGGYAVVGPLVVGLYFPIQLVVQAAFFLNGKDSEAGPHGALLGVWGLLWAACAWSAHHSSIHTQPHDTGHTRTDQETHA